MFQLHKGNKSRESLSCINNRHKTFAEDMSIESPISMEMFYINIGRQNSKQLRHLSAVFVIYHRGILLQQIQTPNQENCCTYLTRCFFVIFIFGFFFFSFLFSFSFFEFKFIPFFSFSMYSHFIVLNFSRFQIHFVICS